MSANDSYNGWKNRQTWNVALWIGNDYGLYQTAVAYVKSAKRPTYRNFLRYAGLEGCRTPDNIAFDGSRLDYNALGEMLRELVD